MAQGTEQRIQKLTLLSVANELCFSSTVDQATGLHVLGKRSTLEQHSQLHQLVFYKGTESP